MRLRWVPRTPVYTQWHLNMPLSWSREHSHITSRYTACTYLCLSLSGILQVSLSEIVHNLIRHPGKVNVKLLPLTWQVGLSSIFLLMKSSTWRTVASPDTRTYRLSKGWPGTPVLQISIPYSFEHYNNITKTTPFHNISLCMTIPI